MIRLFIFAFLLVGLSNVTCLMSLRQIVGYKTHIHEKMTSLHMSTSDSSSKRSKRRSRLKTDDSDKESAPIVNESNSLPASLAPQAPNSMFTADLPLNRKSRLPPIVGTPEYIKAKYEEKGLFDKISSEYLAPTPQGQEPKSVQLIKTITWAAVLGLVLVEIFVSVKVGGMPFDTARQAAQDAAAEAIKSATP